MLLSVIVITYNHEKYLEQSLKSILNQKTKFPIEILVGNDCSTDNTELVLEKYRNNSNITVYNRRNNLGATKNLVDLINRAQGKYIALLEGDDFWIDNYKLQKQVDYLEKHPDCNSISHAHIKVNENNEKLDEYRTSNCETDFFLKDLQKKYWLYQTATLVFRYDQGVDFSKIAELHPLIGDITLSCLLLKNGKMHYFPEVMSAYRTVQKNNKSASGKIAANMKNEYLNILSLYSGIEENILYKGALFNHSAIRVKEFISKYYLTECITKKDYREFMKHIQIKVKIYGYILAFCAGMNREIRIIKQKIKNNLRI
ncbi:glycosyltransferase family 2 protein [Lachnoclostridium phocaeense]|uniref:glycosyltransferase family 2 protein n=1 Tax=Lachnoclostridium phocaeense TaxID=1871021 RepID=UPI00248EF705|nr:glycosyltransferase family 2 protein [Lachnoclostridium phocaeense]